MSTKDTRPSCPSRLKMHSTSDRRALRYARREGWEVYYPPKTYRIFFDHIRKSVPPKSYFHSPEMRFWGAAVRTQKASSPSALTNARSRRPAVRTQKASSPSALTNARSLRPVAPTQKPRVGPRQQLHEVPVDHLFREC